MEGQRRHVVVSRAQGRPSEPFHNAAPDVENVLISGQFSVSDIGFNSSKSELNMSRTSA